MSKFHSGNHYFLCFCAARFRTILAHLYPTQFLSLQCMEELKVVKQKKPWRFIHCQNILKRKVKWTSRTVWEKEQISTEAEAETLANSAAQSFLFSEMIDREGEFSTVEPNPHIKNVKWMLVYQNSKGHRHSRSSTLLDRPSTWFGSETQVGCYPRSPRAAWRHGLVLLLSCH